MRKFKLFFNFIFLICFISSCTGLSDVPKILRNEKIKTTDEFLVKKREPLTEPPDLKELPIPNSKNNNSNKETNGIKNILKEEDKENTKSQTKQSSAEDFIINQIKK